MKTEANFVCETCGYRDTDVNKVMACEARHVQPVTVEAGIYNVERPHPVLAYVDFSDGSRVRYRFDSMVKESKAKE